MELVKYHGKWQISFHVNRAASVRDWLTDNSIKYKMLVRGSKVYITLLNSDDLTICKIKFGLR